MTFRKEDHQAMQDMYHFKIKVDPAFAWGVPELVREIKAEEMQRADPEQALILPRSRPVTLTIRFGGHVAVDSVSCAFQPGTLTAIVGPNGAGKTTYFNLISGAAAGQRAGQVRWTGEDITGLPAPLRTRRGLGRAFQLTQLFANLTVRENVRLAIQAREAGRGVGGGWGGVDLFRVWLDRKAWIDEAQAVLAQVRLADKADLLAAALPHGDQRKLEVALLIALDPKVFMFDEPTAGMSVDEVPVILDLIRGLKAAAGHVARAPSCWWSTRWTWCASWPTASSCCTTASWWPTASRRR
jgi:branched-chain amino acid transport system ATP-binding protein